MPNLVLKAAVADYGQLAARAAYLVSQGRPVRLELHTFGERDVTSAAGLALARRNIARLRQEFPVDALIVHIPPQSVPLVTRVGFDADQCRHTLAFAAEIGAGAVVLHRYFDMVFGQAPPRARDRDEAAQGFGEAVRDLARLAGGMRLLVENVGHYSLLPRDGRNYMTGPLDHFFPWEIERFREALVRDGLTGVEPFIDVAHATLSANLFNRRRAQPRLTDGDARFGWITADDLDRTAWLEPFDFVDERMSYLHVSDAIRLDPQACADPGLDADTLVSAISSEGLELGTGNLPFVGLPARFGTDGDLVLEVEPAPGEDYVHNGAQLRSLEALSGHFVGCSCHRPAAGLGF
ncbi:hypothetical protein [Nitrospirillum amazonense]|uniref:hypothetical protein n=1 Tax=Nitrospirillum amazonense TaxID=28077 RepID=UPI0016457FF9|nr:hypothetical protein [Nitrospirillum amazonense]MDG3438992.1 hypothetical protein [Nitrospirillum amazonense]